MEDKLQKKVDYIYPIFLVIIGIVFFFSLTKPIVFINPDEIEHLRSSFLISQGKVPFLDFFQHHHQLLCYLFAPVFKIIDRNAIIFLVARLFIYATLLGCLWYGIKILDYFKTNKGQNRILFPFIFLFLSIQNVSIFHFRPDTLMIFLFLMGLFYFFHFLNDKRIRFLSLSFLCFTLSFFSLQKIIILYPAIFLACLWLLYKKELTLKQFFIALLPAALTTLFYLSYLLLTGSFKAYFACNFMVNKLLSQTIVHPFHFPTNFFPIYLGFLLIPYLIWKYKNLQTTLLAGLFLSSFIQICFLNPWPQYYIPLFTLFALVLTLFLSSTSKESSQNTFFYSCLGSFLVLSILLFHYITLGPYLSKYMKNYTKLLSVISKDDTVLDEFRHFNIWNPTVTWHEFHLAIKNEYEKLGLPKKDVYATITIKRPTIVDIGKNPIFSAILPSLGYERLSQDEIGFPVIIYKKKHNKLLPKQILEH